MGVSVPIDGIAFINISFVLAFLKSTIIIMKAYTLWTLI